MFRMMTILCFLGLLLLTTNPLAAEVNKLPKGDIPTLFTRAPCDPLPKMLQTMKKYKEELLFTGNGMTFSAKTGEPFRGGMMFFVNQDTGTWSMLQLFGDGMSCMIMNGRDFEPFAGKPMYKDKL